MGVISPESPTAVPKANKGYPRLSQKRASLFYLGPSKPLSPVNTALPDSFAGGWGYHQNNNRQLRAETLREPPK